MKTGFIGLGIMGSRMAVNLLKGGYKVKVYNRTASKMDGLVKAGASAAGSIKEAAEGVDVLFTMLSDPDAVKETATGKNGFLNFMKSNAIWADCSTVNPSFSNEMAEAAADAGIRFIDSPVAGTKLPAEKGELMFLLGGNKTDIDEIMPLLNLMGKKFIYAGETGKGTSMKMVINLLLAGAMHAFAEAMTLGEALGFSKDKLFDLLIGGPVTAPMIAGKKEKLASGVYEADFPLQWMFKDLQLVTTTAYENNIPLPMANVVKEMYSLAVKKGLGEMDFSAIYKFLKE